MAFNINTSRQAAQDSDIETIDDENTSTSETTTECGCGCSPKKNVVATQWWVARVLDNIYKWTCKFHTTDLHVSGPAVAKTVTTEQVVSDNLCANILYLQDKDGRKMKVYIDEDGKLATQYDFRKVYVYPEVSGLTIKDFEFQSGTVKENFKGLTPKQVLSRFLPFADPDFIKKNNRVCFKLCDSDGANELVNHTMLFVCDRTKLISKAFICDEQLNEVRSISLPDDTPVRQLTINMPFWWDSKKGEYVFVEIPSNCGKCHCCLEHHKPPYLPINPPPFIAPPPIVNPLPLNPHLFDDEPMIGDDPLFMNEGNAQLPPLPFDDCNITQGLGTKAVGEDDEEEQQEQSSTSELIVMDEPGTYTSKFKMTTYSNIPLKRSDFIDDDGHCNKTMFLWLELVDANAIEDGSDDYEPDCDGDCDNCCKCHKDGDNGRDIELEGLIN